MGAIELIVSVAIIGLVVWLVTTVLPIPEPFRGLIVKVAYVVAVFMVVLWVLSLLGFVGHFGGLGFERGRL